MGVYSCWSDSLYNTQYQSQNGLLVMSIMVLRALTLSRVASKGRKGGLPENKLFLSQFTGNKLGRSRFTKKKTFLTRIYRGNLRFYRCFCCVMLGKSSRSTR